MTNTLEIEEDLGETLRFSYYPNQPLKSILDFWGNPITKSITQKKIIYLVTQKQFRVDKYRSYNNMRFYILTRGEEVIRVNEDEIASVDIYSEVCPQKELKEVAEIKELISEQLAGAIHHINNILSFFDNSTESVMLQHHKTMADKAAEALIILEDEVKDAKNLKDINKLKVSLKIQKDSLIYHLQSSRRSNKRIKPDLEKYSKVNKRAEAKEERQAVLKAEIKKIEDQIGEIQL